MSMNTSPYAKDYRVSDFVKVMVLIIIFQIIIKRVRDTDIHPMLTSHQVTKKTIQLKYSRSLLEYLSNMFHKGQRVTKVPSERDASFIM